MKFGIDIDDGSQPLPEVLVEENDKIIELYDWQHEAKDYFFKYNQAIFQVSTGAGKTFCAIDIMKEVIKKDPDIMFLIVVPKNVILEQTWFKELYDNGFSLRDVGVFYGAIKEFCKITITNMQSLNKIPLELFDMIVLDECFSGNTNVLVYENNKYIEKKIKDIVNNKDECYILSYNIKEKKLEHKKIVNWYKIRDKREVIDIQFEDKTVLTVTPEQLIFNGEKYITAAKLIKGDKILTIKR